MEKVQEDLDIKRRQFAERMAACKKKEEELKKKQTRVFFVNLPTLVNLVEIQTGNNFFKWNFSNNIINLTGSASDSI